MVEFAIITPLLLLVLFGMIDLGRVFLVQAMATNGAREGARMSALGLTGDVANRADASMPGLDGLTNGGSHTVQVTVACPASPTATSATTVRVQVTNFQWFALGGLSSLFGGGLTPPQPSASSSMRCAG